MYVAGSVENWFMVDLMLSKGFTRETGSSVVALIGFANLAGRVIGSLLRFKFK